MDKSDYVISVIGSRRPRPQADNCSGVGYHNPPSGMDCGLLVCGLLVCGLLVCELGDHTKDPFSRHFTVVNVWNGPDDTLDGIRDAGITLSLVTSHVSHLGLLREGYGCGVDRENAMRSVVFRRSTDLVAAA
ncbi:uncharacterized protein LOC121388629 [Gigantopelta aegis]|uniref:uncharacterized protein LOC121388629 n=1 Tax=Gigantopelta aegis TaxID=1735272 RepID=UPI001B887AEE|nr:uncharacterized protein LOC121388629 [Gigantopelta aegis]